MNNKTGHIVVTIQCGDKTCEGGWVSVMRMECMVAAVVSINGTIKHMAAAAALAIYRRTDVRWW